MKTKQKRILWAAVVVIVLAATIVFVVLGVSGHTFTELKKKSTEESKATGSIDEIFNAVENARKESSRYRRVFMQVTTMKYSFDKTKITVTVFLSKNDARSWWDDEDWSQAYVISKKEDMDEIKTEQLKGPSDAVTTLFSDLKQKLETISQMIELDPREGYSDSFYRLDARWERNRSQKEDEESKKQRWLDEGSSQCFVVLYD